MAKAQYRIMQREFANGLVKYVLEQWNEIKNEWESRYAHTDLDEIRRAKQQKESFGVVSEKIIE